MGLRQKSFQIPHLCFHLSTPFRVLPTLRPHGNVQIAWKCLHHLNKKLHELSSAWSTLVLPYRLDQISIICFKQCLYLGSFMLDICTEVPKTPYQHNRPTLPPFWSIKKVTPVQWPLEPGCLKIFTSLLRNRVFMYLINNQFIESHHQKGFMPGMSR